MDCSICSIPFASRGQPTCASCARALVYQARLDHVAGLVANESLRSRVRHVVASSQASVSPELPSGPELVEITESAKKHAHQQVLHAAKATEMRISMVDEQLRLLRQQMEQATKDKAARRLDMKQRRSDMASEKAELVTRAQQLLEPLQTTIRRSQRRIDKLYARTIEGRTKLCQETARLASLQQRKRRMPDGAVVQDYMIGGIQIFDLRHLNTAHPELVTASLANICRLLTTCCHYLSVRLPAEITPPHAGHPHPTIFSLQSSYQPPASQSPSHKLSASNTMDPRSVPKPRLLHLDRPLVALAKEDPSRYNLFIEGVALLSWNIAWLCTSQGFDVTTAHQAICPLGKNLYTLFREHTRKPPSNSEPAFGQFSHAGVRYNLAATEGADLMRGWRTASFARFLDKIKQILLQDMSGAEWEVISGDDFDEEREDEQAVWIGGTRTSRQTNSASLSRRTVESVDDDSNKGYLKLKNRAG